MTCIHGSTIPKSQVSVCDHNTKWEKKKFQRGLATDTTDDEGGSIWVPWQRLNGRLTAGDGISLSRLSPCLTQCEWARGILIVTSSLDNPQQLLPQARVCACVYVSSVYTLGML